MEDSLVGSLTLHVVRSVSREVFVDKPRNAISYHALGTIPARLQAQILSYKFSVSHFSYLAILIKMVLCRIWSVIATFQR